MTDLYRKHDCLCLGILFADVVCHPISHLPVPGELVPTDRVELSLGGCASNVATNLSRFDMSIGLCGCIGDDPFSDFIEQTMRGKPGVDTSHLTRIANSGPGTSMVLNVQGEDRRFVSTTGANAEFRLTDIPDEWLSPGTIMYIGGFLMMPKLESPETLEVLQRARERRCRIILDVVLYGDRPYWDAIKPLLPLTDVFAPNDHEAERISRLTAPLDQAKFFLDAGAGAAVITCGEKGTLYYSAQEKFRLQTFPTEFVGGTGAGDAFSSGFIAAMYRNLPPVECVTWGSALGAGCVRHISATQSVFSLAELREFLDNHSARCEEIKGV